MSYHRSRSRHRSPSPQSSKRQRHAYRSHERSRSRDRHRSSRHRSSRYEDRSSYHGSSSRHYDNVSANDKRTHSREPTSRHDAVGTTVASLAQETATKPTPTTPESPNVDADEALRKKQERVRKWKEAKRLEQEAKKKAAEQVEAPVNDDDDDEEAKKKLAITAGEKEAEAMRKKQQEREALEKKQKEEAEAAAKTEQEPQLLQQFAAMRKAAAEAAAKEEQDQQEQPEPDTEMKEQEQQNETNGKQWSLEDDLELDEEEMEIDDTSNKENHDEDAERTFKPLQKPKTKEEDSILVKPKKTFLMSNMSTKPKNAMKMGFGLGKSSMTIKKSTPTVKKQEPKPTIPEPVDTVMQDSDDIDPLEAYMLDVHAETKKINELDRQRMDQMNKSANKKRRGSLVQDDDEEAQDDAQAGEDNDIGSDPEDILALAAKKVKRKDIAPVDHSKMDYEHFRKDFYIEPPELRDMTPDQVDLLRIELDGIKIRGVHCPKPITKWTHCGLPAGCLEVIRKLKYEKPTAIQAQAIPAIMNGRDVIGVAKTGSGKTIAFLLPMFRHIKDQRPLEAGEGPIAIIMTPTRELATQIHRECKPFLKVLNLRAVCAYGGSPIKDQIADLKRGCEIIVCTPGRMIDLLCANSGRVTNLKRATYMVMDEADRMFDMGFEPQVMKIVNNVRPSRQTVLFSATFPRQMEALARKVLKKPLEITVGGRSVVCDDVNQIVEVREEDTKFVRLLEILGKLFHDEGEEEASAIIFVDRHEAADNLLRDLIRRGYPCQSLHGGKDQADRDSTIADFKSGVTNVLIATSVAARGLDVKKLKMVINYECPNHMEDYVHRVGRTGRAGNKGTAYTFITPDQDRYAMDICKALKLSGQPVPPDLQALSDSFQNKVKEGKERASGSGFGGKGLERLDKDRDLVKKLQKKAYGGDEDSDDEEIELESNAVPAGMAAGQSAAKPMDVDTPKDNGKDDSLSAALLAAKKAAMVAARITALGGSTVQQVVTEDGETRPIYAEEIVINDYPQKARWRVTNKVKDIGRYLLIYSHYYY
ncbi:P-loop containing nucleoside triphosphate hydrolase protein [Gilbertella persicaria]|uniref:P-loop containing nucleoside triphosphate hydrolase protein n=1 Tax=Gilbertella persicaria TaxID=101096 RepID=UPI00221F595B|nr:P-loop containing nucleoside triphosphate hydrolase protein [Gilbertella persicaria]KAI8079667.1 P-loop containing nucleoside triphosphate hydrolase protein [Gilbertella persicaria]